MNILNLVCLHFRFIICISLQWIDQKKPETALHYIPMAFSTSTTKWPHFLSRGTISCRRRTFRYNHPDTWQWVSLGTLAKDKPTAN